MSTKTNYFPVLFLLLVVGNLIATGLNAHLLESVLKSLLMPVLIAWFIVTLGKIKTNLKNWIIAALFFSWMGDVLLVFQEKSQLFFLLGLSSFLVAHIFYIIFFHQLRVREAIKPNAFYLLIVVIYYGVLIWWLGPYLGDMKLPVRIYGIVISFMLMLALHMFSLKGKTTGRLLIAGAVLFFISDSILAINKFYKPFEGAGLLIMSSYALAQLLLVYGAMNYINKQPAI